VSDAAGEDGERHLHFEHEIVRIGLVVTAAGNRWDLRGHVDPPQLRVELELEAPGIAVAEDATHGGFAFEAVPSGIMRLRLLARDGAGPLTTDWFRA